MPKLYLKFRSAVTRVEEEIQLDVEWQIREDDGSLRGGGTTDFRGLSDLIDPSADWLKDPDNVVVFLPAERVLSMRCLVPGRSTAQIRRALPFVVEEFVASDIETLHIANGVVTRGEPVAVSLVDRVLLEDWLASLEALELNAGHMLSEADLLPQIADGAAVLFDGDSVVVRGAEQAAALDRENLLLALGALEEISELALIAGELDELERGQLDPEITVSPVPTEATTAFDYLIERWNGDHSVTNLLQGPYAPKKAERADLGRWQAVATLAGVWVIVGLVGLVAQGFWASARADSLEQQGIDLVRDIFPDMTRINNAQRQMRQRLGGSATDGSARGFADYLGFLAQGTDRNASILSLNYTEARGELAADLLVRNYDELERMKQRLAQLGVEVEITSAEQQDTAVRARIRLRGA